MRVLDEIDLVEEAAVPHTASFLDAAEALSAQPVAVVAVLDGERRVVGLFGDEELLRGLFPPYLAELHHTAFAEEDLGLLAERTKTMRETTVAEHMRKPVAVDRRTSAMHLAERFLHSDLPALPVVEGQRFVGMVARADLCRALLKRV